MSNAPVVVVVRRTVPDDAAEIARVMLAAFEEFRPLFTPAAFVATAVPAEGVHERIREGPVWVAVRDGAIVGTLAAVDEGADLYIRGMALAPEARGQGVAALLLRAAEAFAAESGAARAYLTTTAFMTAAIALYTSFGFRFAELPPEDLFGTELLVMEKTLRES
jgi:GNAT superfamily N-acetyltransferase